MSTQATTAAAQAASSHCMAAPTGLGSVGATGPIEFLAKLLDTRAYPARWGCGEWTAFEGWLHIASDLLTWAAYMAIPLTIVFFLRKRRSEVAFPLVGWLFAAFIFFCGSVHLVEAVIFWTPVYRLSGLLKAATAVVSLATVVALFRVTPQALALPGLARLAQELERENQQRRDAEERMRLIADTAPSMIWMTDSAGEIVFANQRWTQFTGSSPTDETHPDWMRWMHPGDRERVAAILGADHQRQEVDCRLRSHEDQATDHWFLVSREARRGPDGRLEGHIFSATDITDRKLHEREVAESNHRFRSLVMATAQIVWGVDSRGKFVDVEGWGATFGPAQPETLEQALAGAAAPETAPGALAAWASARAAAAPADIPLRLLTLDRGERDYLLHAVPLDPSPEGPVEWIGTLADVTELRRAEAERHQLERERLQLQKLESLGVLAGGIAHDFNNILVGIMGNASFALYNMGPDDPARPLLEQVEKSSERAAALTRQMLAYSGGGKFIVHRMSLNERVGGIGTLVHSSLTKKARLRFELDPALPAVEADPSQVDQLLMNLVINAAEALGEEEGDVVVRTRLEHLDERALRSGAVNDHLPAGPYVCLEVEDNGCGMDKATVARIFDPFYTTKFTGRGLGLAAVLGIVRSHKGALRVESTLGVGTRFIVCLPAVDAPASVLAAAGGGGSRMPQGGGKAHVLVVDDEPACRQLASALLSEHDFRFTLARDGREALTLYQQHADEYDLVVLDLMMPGLSGGQVLRAIRELRPEAAVLLSSGYEEATALEHTGGLPVQGFLHKPYTVDQFLDAVRSAMQAAE